MVKIKGYTCRRFDTYQNEAMGRRAITSSTICPLFIDGKPWKLGEYTRIIIDHRKLEVIYRESKPSEQQILAEYLSALIPVYDRIKIPLNASQILPLGFESKKMILATDNLDKLFSNNISPIKIARGLGLAVTEKIPILKRLFIKI